MEPRCDLRLRLDIDSDASRLRRPALPDNNGNPVVDRAAAQRRDKDLKLARISTLEHDDSWFCPVRHLLLLLSRRDKLDIRLFSNVPNVPNFRASTSTLTLP